MQIVVPTRQVPVTSAVKIAKATGTMIREKVRKNFAEALKVISPHQSLEDAAVTEEGLGPQQHPKSRQDIRRLIAKDIKEEVIS